MVVKPKTPLTADRFAEIAGELGPCELVRGRVFTGEPGIITQREPDTVRGADVVYFSYKRLAKGKRPKGSPP